MLLNYTNVALTFVDRSNLVRRRNNRFQAQSREILRVIQYLPTAGPCLMVQFTVATVEHIGGVPIEEESIQSVDALPDGDDILIVSKQYADACRKLCRPTDRLRVTVGAVYVTGETYPVAATGLARTENCLTTVPDFLTHDQATAYIAKRQQITL